MKLILISAAILAVCHVTAGSVMGSRPRTTDVRLDYMQYLRERQQMAQLRHKFETFCPGKEDEFNEAMLQMKRCTDSVDENEETACSTFSNHFPRCIAPILRLMESCVPEESKEIPKLLFEMINSGIKYACKADGEHIFELANTCIFKNSQWSTSCENKMMSKMQQFNRQPPTKQQFCQAAISFEHCLHRRVVDSCGHRITKEAFTGFFEALLAPCKTVEENSANEVELLELRSGVY